MLFATNYYKSKKSALQLEIDGANILNASFSKWIPDVTLESNIHLIIFLTITTIALIFLIIGLCKHFKKIIMFNLYLIKKAPSNEGA